MKKLLGIALALTLAVVCCSCGSSASAAAGTASSQPGGSPSAAEGGTAGKGVTITVAMWGDNSRKDLYEPLFAPFEEATGIDVEIQVYTNSEYATKVLTEISGGKGPDVVWLTERYYPMFADAGILANMNSLMEDPEYHYEDFSASLVGNYTVNGDLMAIPFTANPLAFFYNTTLFKNAGLETPLELYNKGEWTIDKMIECAKALTDKSKGTYGLSLVQPVDPGNWPVLMDYFWACGVDFFNADTSAVTINDQAGIAALQQYYDLMFTDGCCVVPGEMVSFESGQLAMYPGNPSEGNSYQDTGFEWDYICYPSTNAGRNVNVVGVAMYSVLNTSENYEEAVEVVKYITGQAMQAELSGVFTPTREPLKTSDSFLTQTASMPSPEGRKIVYLDVFSAETKTYPATTNWNEINTIGQQIFDQLYTGAYSAEEVAAELDNQINALLH